MKLYLDRILIVEEPLEKILPWPDLKIPEYHPFTLGEWTLRKCENLPQLGYFHERQGAGTVYALLKNGQSWMSTAWDEIESQAPHVAAARGHTVVMGAGMGIVLYNILLKPEVERVTLVERDPLVIELLHQITNLDEWPGIDKLNVAVCDAFDYRPSWHVDYLYVDIWADPGDPQALPDMQQIQKNVRAETLGWWTQEIDFLFWLERNGHSASCTLEQYRSWAAEIGLPLIEQDNRDYPACVTQVARSYCYRMVRERLSHTHGPLSGGESVQQNNPALENPHEYQF